jgi:predicted ATPase
MDLWDERYERLGWLGDGGMGRVEAASDRQTGRRVALKRLLSTTPAHRERQAREVDAQRRVRHERVLPVLDVLSSPDGLVLVLPFVQGPPLSRLLSVGLPLGQRLALFRDLVEGVAAIHRSGLVHRDLKPSNVLLDASGERVLVYVSDFGLAEALQDKDARADVWSLGAILRELLGQGAAGPWADLAQRLLSDDPQSRPADAGEVLARLPPTEPLSPSLARLCRELGPEPRPRPAPPGVPRQLPSERDAFVGRHEELRALGRKMASSRLVSVVGTAGVGKTRLAVRYASLWLERYPGGVFFCDLSRARDLDGLVMHVAQVLEVPLGKGDPALQLGHALRGRGAALLVLDNLEQVTGPAGELLARWLPLAPELRLLATSREALGLDGEVPLGLEPLALLEAEILFWRRWREAEPSFSPSPEDELAIGKLAGLLDQLPLAIELAAARVRLLSPAEILARLGERFRLLATSGRRDRHATLLAALDWSWELLSPDEQRALAQLSVFDGGATEEAAGAVLQPGSLSPADACARLVQRSLVRRGEAGRLSLLMSVQQYARHKLGRDKIEAEARHGRYFAASGSEAALDALHTHGGVQRRRALALELDNLISASRRAMARGEGEVAAATALAAWAVLERRGPFALGATLLGEVAPTSRQATVLRCAGRAEHMDGRVEAARARYEAALACSRQRAGLREESHALISLAVLAREQGRMDEAREQGHLALQLARRVGDRLLEGMSLNNLGSVYKISGPTAEALVHHREALAVFRAAGDRANEGATLNSLAIWHQYFGDKDEALVCYEQAREIAREVGDRALEGGSTGNLGSLYTDLGQLDKARVCGEQARRIFREIGLRQFECAAVGNLAVLACLRSELEEAHTLYAQALVLAREIGHRRFEGDLLSGLAVVHADLGEFEEARGHHERALELHREVGARQSESFTLLNLGSLCEDVSQLEPALAYYEAALQIARDLGDQTLEGRALSHLAHVHLAQGRLQQAEEDYEAALLLLRAQGNARHEAVTLGNLGRLYAEQGLWSQARAHLDEGERLLRGATAPAQLGKLLVARAEVEHRAGDTARAQALLAEAEQIAAELGTRPTAELGRDLARARRELRRE